MDHFFDVDGATRATLLSIFSTVRRTPAWPQVKGSCFCMAGFLALVFESLGAKAQVQACYAEVAEGDDVYALGYRGLTTGEDQVEGHVVCVVDGRFIVDFGTTNIQRYFVPTFPVAVAASISGTSPFPAAVNMGEGRTVTWHADPDNERVRAAMIEHEAFSKEVFRQYQRARLHGRKMRRSIARRTRTAG